MAKKPHVPKLRHHKASGQGYVELAGKRTYLGRYDLPETRQRYGRLIAEWDPAFPGRPWGTPDPERPTAALRKIGPDAAIPALIDALGNDPHWYVRQGAAGALGMFGADAKPAVPALIEALRDENDYVRGFAIGALRRIGPAPDEALPALAEFDSLGTATALWLGPAAVPMLIEKLKHENYKVRKAAAETLGKMGSHRGAGHGHLGLGRAVPALVEALSDRRAIVRPAAFKALMRIDPEAAKGTVPILTEALTDTGMNRSTYAAKCLRLLGPDAAAAVPALMEAIEDEHGWIRANAARVLGDIGPLARESIPALTEALRDENRNVRKRAAESLGKYGAHAGTAVPALIDVLKDRDWRNKEVRVSAAGALGRIGPPASEAIPALTELLGDTSLLVRRAAADALKQIQPHDNSGTG